MPTGFRQALALVLLTVAFGTLFRAGAQQNPGSDNPAKTLATGTFHGKAHKTSGRATVYQRTRRTCDFDRAEGRR
jgi:hypothetical protein